MYYTYVVQTAVAGRFLNTRFQYKYFTNIDDCCVFIRLFFYVLASSINANNPI